jgi:hypothetical protein
MKKGIEGTVILSLEPRSRLFFNKRRDLEPFHVTSACGQTPVCLRRSSEERRPASNPQGRWWHCFAEVVGVRRLPPADQAKKAREKETNDPDELYGMIQPLTLLHPILPLSVVVWTIR